MVRTSHRVVRSVSRRHSEERGGHRLTGAAPARTGPGQKDEPWPPRVAISADQASRLARTACYRPVEEGGPSACRSTAGPRGSIECMFGSDLHDLNESQRLAVEHGNGPLLVLAGAGTGKTATLASRVAHLLRRGVAPERVCLLTFSRRAAQEML